MFKKTRSVIVWKSRSVILLKGRKCDFMVKWKCVFYGKAGSVLVWNDRKCVCSERPEVCL